MEVFWYILLLVLGFVAVVKGADFLVDGASSLALKYGVSELTIGLTIVAFGTSAPELAVNIQATDGIMFGNVIGSNNFNLLAILGIAGFIYPMTVQRKTIFVEIPFAIFGIVLLLILANDSWFGHSENLISALDAFILLGVFAAFLFYVFKTSKREILAEELDLENEKPLWQTIGMIVLGIAGLIIGGQLVVKYAELLALKAGVSETIIALTVVSLGTSLPELATAVVAAFKKRPDLAVGNVIGSNIFNVLLIIGVSSLAKHREYTDYLNTDNYITILGTAALFIFMFTKRKKVLDKVEAFFLVLGFAAYMVFILNRELNFF